MNSFILILIVCLVSFQIVHSFKNRRSLNKDVTIKKNGKEKKSKLETSSSLAKFRTNSVLGLAEGDNNNINKNNNEKTKRLIRPEDLFSAFDKNTPSDDIYFDEQEEIEDSEDDDNMDNENTIAMGKSNNEMRKDSSQSLRSELNKLEMLLEGNNNDKNMVDIVDNGDGVSNDDDIEFEDGDGESQYYNFDLTETLDKSRRKKIQGIMTVDDQGSPYYPSRMMAASSTPATSSSGRVSISKSNSNITTFDNPRLFQYNPAPSVRGNAMLYGAYRRSLLPESDEGSSVKSKTTKRKNNPLKGNKNNISNKKSKGETDRDKFYDAIRKLGSGPRDAGDSMGTGVAEPPSNMKNIMPKKAPTKKNKKRIITPDDINNLFAKPASSSASEAEADDDEEEDVNDDDEEDTGDSSSNNAIISQQSKEESSKELQIASTGSVFNPMLMEGEEIPKWLVDADKAAKKKKAMAGKKKKKITDDWRFWAAIITTAGFAAAFYNVFQQVGGFGDGGRSPDELII